MIPTHDFSIKEKCSVRMNELQTLTHYDSGEIHRHNYFEFFYFEHGGGTHLIDFVDFEITSSSFHIVAPGQVHQVKRELNTNGFVFLFELDSFNDNSLIETFLMDHICYDVQELNPFYLLDGQDAEDLKRIIQSAWLEYQGESTYKNQLVYSYLNILLLKCLTKQKNYYSNDEAKEHDLYTRFRRALNKNYRSLKLVKEYADLLYVTQKHLNDIVYRKTGQTVSTLIYKQLILEAKRLLNTGMNIKEVAYSLEFNDPAHFSKFFKTQTGYSPSDFQKVHE